MILEVMIFILEKFVLGESGTDEIAAIVNGYIQEIEDLRYVYHCFINLQSSMDTKNWALA